MGDTREKLNDISDVIGKLQADYPAETNAFLNPESVSSGRMKRATA